MKRVSTLILIGGLLVWPLFAGQQAPSEAGALKARQKQELQVLELKKQYAHSAIRDSQVPKAVRIQMKHELQREQRKLRERQKDERQTLKDSERLLRLERKQLGSE